MVAEPSSAPTAGRIRALAARGGHPGCPVEPYERTGNMIRHRPHGSEHPYATTPDQRVPASPEVNEPVLLGVLAAPTVTSINCYWTDTGQAGSTTTELELSAVNPADAGSPLSVQDGGHLAAAQARSERGSGRWQVQVPPLQEGHRYTYRFQADSIGGTQRRSRVFSVEPSTWTKEARGSELHLPGDRLVPGSVSWRRTADGVNRVRFAMHLKPGERVVGFGERFDYLDQRGNRLDAVVFEQYKSQGAHGRTYLPMPFAHVVAPDGSSWGFHIRTARRSWYDIAATTPNQLIIEADLGGQPQERLEVAVYQGGPGAVLDQFLSEVGRPEILPDWVFQLWASGNEWNTQAIVLERMDHHRDLDIPVGAVVIEAWSDEEGITIFRDAQYLVNETGCAHQGADFTYPPGGAWPDPAGMVAELHRRGIRVVLWQIPLQKMRPHPQGQAKADAQAMIRDGHAVLEADGRPYRNRGWWFPQALMPDLSVQRTRDWWTEKRRYLVRDLDIDGFKTDGGEHAWGHDLRYADGRRGNEGNNLYPVHYAKAFGDLLRSEGKAPVTFSRSGFTGSQAHGIVWAGDENSTWEAFRNSITAGLTASASGIIYWSWDLAGFSGPVPDAELYLRATAAATFMPVMQYHSEFNHHRRPLRDRTPWHVQHTTGDHRVVPVFRRFAHLRQALVPYLSHQTAEAIKRGQPLMRAMFFDHPDLPQIWSHPRQYKLGDHLLINPVTEPAATRWSTFLPPGSWIDVWTGEKVPGETVVDRSVSIDQIPVYAQEQAWPELVATFRPRSDDRD